MQHATMGLLLAFVLAVAGSSRAAAAPAAPTPAFADCTSAFNAGESTARYFTSASYNRIACHEAEVDATENLLANVVKSRGELSTGDSDDDKRCYYGGFYSGYADQTSNEYAQCGNVGRFRAVTRATLATMAEAVFVHAIKLPLPADRGQFVTAVFGIDDSFVAPCDRACKAACDRQLANRIASDVPNADAEVVRMLTVLVCKATI